MTSGVVTPGGIVIEVGQVWRDNDKRSDGRRVRIIAVMGTRNTIRGIHAARILPDGTLGRRVRMSAYRMTPKRFTLVEHPDGRPV